MSDVIEKLRRLTNPPCDECGKPIEGGHTKLHTGQIVHHECADEVLDDE